jgi:hypothetical protein
MPEIDPRKYTRRREDNNEFIIKSVDVLFEDT